jgi:deazaflavin-dependent oxidoreductase (nitroreductase family)
MQWVRDQVDAIESSCGSDGMMLRGMPVILMTMRGAVSGKVRKVPVMRVEHDGVYAAVASKGGAPDNPLWYANLVANPNIAIQDGTMQRAATAREVHGAERAVWWERAVAAFPDYVTYQTRTDREIPVLVLE